ncbi:MAG: monovalent cation/H(+) antiporter subunit G [Gammaproteobacteria bacterium]|nr:monovalent cation/H(+) antiporter subunit G [Gammaproteobacteria bacterium]
MEVLIHIFSALFVALGVTLLLAGGIGLIRMPDLYTRLHAASVTDTGATIMIIIGLVAEALLIFDNPMAAIKLALILFFTLFTAPTASHALAKTALLGGLIPTDEKGQPLLSSGEDARQFGDSSQPDPEGRQPYHTRDVVDPGAGTDPAGER